MTDETQTTVTYRVEFERVGRRRDLPPQHFKAVDADDLAEQIHRFADRFLGSSWFTTGVDLEQMQGSIEGGRFGRFTLTEVPS